MAGEYTRDRLEGVVRAAEAMPEFWRAMKLGRQLRFLRHSRRISQRQLAEAAGVVPSIVSRLERGGDGRWSTWQRLFDALAYEVVPVVLPAEKDDEDCDEYLDYLRFRAREREERAAQGRESRWGRIF